MGDPTPFPSSAAIKRAEQLTRERFVFEGETPEVCPCAGFGSQARARRRADRGRGRAQGPVARVAPGVLAAARARARALRGGAEARRRHRALRPPGRCAVGHADGAAGGRADGRRTAPDGNARGGEPPRGRRTRSRPIPTPTTTTSSRRDVDAEDEHEGRGRGELEEEARAASRDEEPQDWQDDATDLDEDIAPRAPPMTPAPTVASGSSTRPAPARRSPRSASSRPRAPAAC